MRARKIYTYLRINVYMIKMSVLWDGAGTGLMGWVSAASAWVSTIHHITVYRHLLSVYNVLLTNASVELKRSKEGSGTFCAVFAIQISFKSVAFPFSNSLLENNMGAQLRCCYIYSVRLKAYSAKTWLPMEKSRISSPERVNEWHAENSHRDSGLFCQSKYIYMKEFINMAQMPVSGWRIYSWGRIHVYFVLTKYVCDWLWGFLVSENDG